MPGRKEFTYPVGGSTGGPVKTSAANAFETNNYKEGGTFTVGDGTNAYPHTVDPAETIEELVVTGTGTDIVADITTASGTVLSDVPLRGAAIVSDSLSIDVVTFKYPDATGTATFGWWVGE